MSNLSWQRQGRRALLLAGLILLPLAAAQAAAPSANQANVNLETDISTMAVHVGQSAPLPPGGCNPGYAWHTTYGGCRIAQKQSESAQCPAGQTGTRQRDRITYTLQANAADVAYDGWSEWKGECKPPAPPAGKVCGFDVKKLHVLLDYTNPWSTQPSVFLVWDGAIVGSADSIASGSASIMSQWWHDFRKNGAVIGDWRYSMGNEVAVNSADTGIFDPDDIYAYYEICREPVAAPSAPQRVILTWVKWPGDTATCAPQEWKVHATYENGSPAQGITLTWSLLVGGQGETPLDKTKTDANGDSSSFSADYSGLSMICVAFHWSVVPPGGRLDSFTAPQDKPGETSAYLVNTGPGGWMANRVRWVASPEPSPPPEEIAYKMGETAYVRSVPINPAGVGGPPPPALSWKGKNIPLTMPEGSAYLTEWEGYRYYAIDLKDRRQTARNGMGLFYSVRRVKL